MRPIALLVAGAAVFVGVAAVFAQRSDVFVESRDHPSIDYSSGPVRDVVSELNRKIQEGTVQLKFEGASGYLRSVLDALKVPAESQLLAFSQTSFQFERIGPRNPRAIFFNDAVAVGWVRGAPILELAAHDPQQGVIFYQLDYSPVDKPEFKRTEICLACHLSWDTLGVPGLLLLSTFPMSEDKNAYAGGFVSDHRRSLEQRWGGWYATSKHVSVRHIGNVTKLDELDSKAVGAPAAVESLEGRFDTNGYLSPYSDIVALMVLEHQTHLVNLLTRLGWETRLASYEERTTSTPLSKDPGNRGGVTARVRDIANELVDYMLFVDEAPLVGRIQGSSGFTEKFSAQGPRDSKGRSLRQLRLEGRLMRYPCSYMIYTEAFDALPVAAKNTVYERMWQILSGQDKQASYAVLALADRQAIVEILRETKNGLPDYFQPVTR